MDLITVTQTQTDSSVIAEPGAEFDVYDGLVTYAGDQ